MIRVEKIIGNINKCCAGEYEIDVIEIAWYDTRKKIARLKTKANREVAMRLMEAPKNGINHGDIIYQDEKLIIVFHILETKVLCIQTKDIFEVAKIGYEIGNRHAPLFFGKNALEFQTPYELPLQKLMDKLNIEYEIKNSILDSKNRLSVSMPHREAGMTVALSNDFRVNIIKGV